MLRSQTTITRAFGILFILVWVLECILLFGYPSLFHRPLNLLVMPILIMIAFVLTFVFHFDLVGMNRFSALMVLAEEYRPEREDEREVFRERMTTGAYNRFEPAWHNLIHLRLTNRRFIARFVASRKGLCLLDVDISSIVSVESPKLRKILGVGFLKINLKGMEKVRSFNLQTYRSARWREAFSSVGVEVKE